MPLDSSRLSSRIRDLLRGGRQAPGTRDEVRPIEERDLPADARAGPRYVADPDADSAWRAPGGCSVIERHYDLDVSHGRHPVGSLAATLDGCLPALATLGAVPRPGSPGGREHGAFDWEADEDADGGLRAPAVPSAGPLLFFDLETTGLSGGAGTVAFLVGCGWADGDGFHTRQFFLSGYEAEHDLLVGLAALLPRFGGLVTYNGRAFDVPLIETRYLFHRLDSPFEGVPHFDMLPTARRLWRRRSGGAGRRGAWSARARADWDSCALSALEPAILGVERDGDVPGFEIPSRYFHYLRSGDGSGLEAVFEHNRLDLLSLAAVTAIAMRLVIEGADAVPTPHEALALGQIYERAGHGDGAEACYARAAGAGSAPWEPRSVEAGLRADALRRLAVYRRRHRRFEDAADAWHQLIEMAEPHPYRQEATRALAIHHEHRVKDLARARAWAERALETEPDPGGAEALRHRLSRLDRKMGKGQPAARDSGRRG